jgi:predicted transcriptional regulator
MSATQVDNAAAIRKKKKEIRRRRAKVLEMFNKGFSQIEMAEVLGVDQSTISRDVNALSIHASRGMDKIFEHHFLEIERMGAMHDAAMKRIWELVDNKDLTVRQRMEALSLLLKCYNSRKEAIPSRRDKAIYQKGLESVYGDD